MPKIKLTIIQRDWNGKGDDREHVRWIDPSTAPQALGRVERAYDMAHTTVILDGEDVTGSIA